MAVFLSPCLVSQSLPFLSFPSHFTHPVKKPAPLGRAVGSHGRCVHARQAEEGELSLTSHRASFLVLPHCQH